MHARQGRRKYPMVKNITTKLDKNIWPLRKTEPFSTNNHFLTAPFSDETIVYRRVATKLSVTVGNRNVQMYGFLRTLREKTLQEANHSVFKKCVENCTTTNNESFD